MRPEPGRWRSCSVCQSPGAHAVTVRRAGKYFLVKVEDDLESADPGQETEPVQLADSRRRTGLAS